MISINERNARLHAIYSAYLNILANLIEFFMAVQAGVDEGSLSMFGVALMTIVGITGSVLVLFRWQYISGDDKILRLREMQFSFVLGMFMTILGMFFLKECTLSLKFHGRPITESEGVLVALFGAVFSLGLTVYKYNIGLVLDSHIVLTDASLSFCLGMTCLTTLVVVVTESFIWWADDALGFVVALYTLYVGLRTTFQARAEIDILHEYPTAYFEEASREDRQRFVLRDDEKESLMSKSAADRAASRPVDGLTQLLIFTGQIRAFLAGLIAGKPTPAATAGFRPVTADDENGAV